MDKYLVCRMESVRPAGVIKHSMHFPMVVEAPYFVVGDILERALSSIGENYRPSYEYLVVSLKNAHVVSMRPKRDYELVVKDYV